MKSHPYKKGIKLLNFEIKYKFNNLKLNNNHQNNKWIYYNLKLNYFNIHNKFRQYYIMIN